MTSIETFKNKYIQHLKVLNRSKETIYGYQNILNIFIDFLTSQAVLTIYDLTKEIILEYQKDNFYKLNQKGQQNTAEHQNNHIKVIKSFCFFLYKEGYLSYDPSRNIEYAKTPERLPKVILTKNEIKKLIKSPDISTPLGYRDRTILEVLYSTGIRNKELRNLKLNDVDYERGFLRVEQGKGNKDRVVPLGSIACKYVENYIKLVRIDLHRKQESEYLFLSLQGTKLDTSTLRNMVKKQAKRVRLKKKVTPHVFRHTCATHLINQKADVRCVQEILGHKKLDTTQKYIQVTITDLKEAHQKAHPREREYAKEHGKK